MKIPFALLESFASRDKDALAALQCVYLDCESRRLLATDGHMAARVCIGLDEGDVSGLVPRGVIEALDRLAAPIRKGDGGGMSITVEGHEPVVIDKEAAENIHRNAESMR